MDKTFPTLYKLTSTGEIQEWTIIVRQGNQIITRFGRHGGKIQESAPDVIAVGKNVGKKNATTPDQQAMAEAQSAWEKKLKTGYVKTIDEARGGAVSDLVEGGAWPMLAKRYAKDGGKISWPAFAQPKLDGHRCIAVIHRETGKCTLWSRTRKPIRSVPHIVAAIEKLQLHKLAGTGNIILDGELYNHDYHDRFEELTHFIRQSEPESGCEVIQYHIYDTITATGFEQRTKWLTLIAKKFPQHGPLVFVETISVDDEDALMSAFEHFRGLGYEGCMVRNTLGDYDGHPTHRSSNLQKVKEFDDAEFKVIGVLEGRGKLAGHGIFSCVTDKGVQFEAKMIGKLEDLKQYLADPEKAVGRMLTVKFQGTTNTGKPRFPVALRFREDI